MTRTILISLLLSGTAVAQECTDQWRTHFDTNPLHSKYLTGDTSTGYAVLNFWGNPDVVLEIRGEYPHSRFMSFETESTRLAISEDHLFDFDVEPDVGSDNPFREGTALDTAHRSYRVLAMQDKPDGLGNAIRLPSGRLSQAIMYRIYSPHEGVTLSRADLPRVFAYDREGNPVPCPRSASYDEKFHFPEFFADIYTTFMPFEFKVAGNLKIAGLNKAAGYMYAVTPLKRDEVVRIRFQAPTFVLTRSGTGVFRNDAEVRYWSFCTGDFTKNLTLNCLPDFLSHPDADGMVTLVVGTGDDVAQAAESRGFAFLPDVRKRSQRVMGFVYRNLVPSADFKANRMYQGAYAPDHAVCSRASFLTGGCD